ncbi:MAG: biotin--[acetyl-CoA-carboxylase] ligase [Syntrophales bacterium]|nr:biotin--[acetyl-CoA-carboxylase] ligase [Syntrophales bacterium]
MERQKGGVAILRVLKERYGLWVSGDELSNNLGVSRCAVWKVVSSLRKNGYFIEARRNKGYRLYGVSDCLLPLEIKSGLETKIIGKERIVRFEETDSTNIRAFDLARKGAPEGTVVVAEGQTHGCGRRKRMWFSPWRKGIYVSIVLRPLIHPTQTPRISILAALAVAEALRKETGLCVTIKWPNDLLVNGRKIGGVLSEIAADSETVEFIIVGAGLNVNLTREEFPEDISCSATSVLMETGKVFHRIPLLVSYINHFDAFYTEMMVKGFERLRHLYIMETDIIGRRVRLQTHLGQSEGIVEDLDINGCLLVRDVNGQYQQLWAGDLTFV